MPPPISLPSKFKSYFSFIRRPDNDYPQEQISLVGSLSVNPMNPSRTVPNSNMKPTVTVTTLPFHRRPSKRAVTPKAPAPGGPRAGTSTVPSAVKGRRHTVGQEGERAAQGQGQSGGVQRQGTQRPRPLPVRGVRPEQKRDQDREDGQHQNREREQPQAQGKEQPDKGNSVETEPATQAEPPHPEPELDKGKQRLVPDSEPDLPPPQPQSHHRNLSFPLDSHSRIHTPVDSRPPVHDQPPKILRPLPCIPPPSLPAAPTTTPAQAQVENTISASASKSAPRSRQLPLPAPPLPVVPPSPSHPPLSSSWNLLPADTIPSQVPPATPPRRQDTLNRKASQGHGARVDASGSLGLFKAFGTSSSMSTTAPWTSTSTSTPSSTPDQSTSMSIPKSKSAPKPLPPTSTSPFTCASTSTSMSAPKALSSSTSPSISTSKLSASTSAPKSPPTFKSTSKATAFATSHSTPTSTSSTSLKPSITSVSPAPRSPRRIIPPPPRPPPRHQPLPPTPGSSSGSSPHPTFPALQPRGAWPSTGQSQAPSSQNQSSGMSYFLRSVSAQGGEKQVGSSAQAGSSALSSGSNSSSSTALLQPSLSRAMSTQARSQGRSVPVRLRRAMTIETTPPSSSQVSQAAASTSRIAQASSSHNAQPFYLSSSSQVQASQSSSSQTQSSPPSCVTLTAPRTRAPSLPMPPSARPRQAQTPAQPETQVPTQMSTHTQTQVLSHAEELSGSMPVKEKGKAREVETGSGLGPIQNSPESESEIGKRVETGTVMQRQVNAIVRLAGDQGLHRTGGGVGVAPLGRRPLPPTPGLR